MSALEKGLPQETTVSALAFPQRARHIKEDTFA